MDPSSTNKKCSCSDCKCGQDCKCQGNCNKDNCCQGCGGGTEQKHQHSATCGHAESLSHGDEPAAAHEIKKWKLH